MHVFKNESFEIGINLNQIDGEGIHDMFRVIRDCPECSLHEEELLQLEKEVWQAYLSRSPK